MKGIVLNENEITNGRLADILATAKFADQIEMHAHEAVDLAVLPTETLISLTTRLVSLRWTSRPVFFPNLQKWTSLFSDINLNLFRVTSKFKELFISDIHLWNSSISDIKDKLGNLSELSITCNDLQDTCPFGVVDLGSLPHESLERLHLEKVVVSANAVKGSSFSQVLDLQIIYCQLHENILTNLHQFFPSLEVLGISIDLAIRPGLFRRAVSKKYIRTFQVTINPDAKPWVVEIFRSLPLSETNLTLPEIYYNRVYYFLLYRDGVEWKLDYFDITLDVTTPLSNLVRKLFGFTVEGEALYATYNAYVSYVYVLSSLGLIGNFLSLVVLMQKSMQSSNSFLLSGLAIWDSAFLVTSILKVEEFNLLSYKEYIRSQVVGYILYPINKTGSNKNYT